jgi:nucleoid-associated protein YejK
MTMNVDINRLHISLHGVSAQMIEAAMLDMDKELGERLEMQGPEYGFSHQSLSVNIDEMALRPIHMDATVNVAGLRGLIADRLLEAIEQERKAMQVAAGSDG